MSSPVCIMIDRSFLERMPHELKEAIAEDCEDYLIHRHIPLQSHSYDNIIIHALKEGYQMKLFDRPIRKPAWQLSTNRPRGGFSVPYYVHSQGGITQCPTPTSSTRLRSTPRTPRSPSSTSARHVAAPLPKVPTVSTIALWTRLSMHGVLSLSRSVATPSPVCQLT